jgi:hypothetical protein
VGAFLFVFQNLAGLRVDANFLRHGAALNVEGIAQSGPTFFFSSSSSVILPGCAFKAMARARQATIKSTCRLDVPA